MGPRVVRYAMAVVMLSVSAHALSEAPPQFETVERYASIVTEGGSLATTALTSVLAADMAFAEYALHWSDHRATAAHAHIWTMLDTNVRLEVAFEAALAGGSVVVTRERMWGDDVPEALAPLHSTVVYVVAGERIQSITRVLDTEQRDVLMREALIGTWYAGGGVMRFDADGSYRFAGSRSLLESAPLDSGTYAIEDGTWRVVSDDTTSICQPADEGVWLVHVTTADTFELVEVDEMCRTNQGRGQTPGSRLRAMRIVH